MSKRTGPTKVNLTDFKERKEAEGAIDVETADGQVFRIPPPEVWPDEFVKSRKDLDPEQQARLLLGDEAFDRFVAAGGSIMLALSIVKEYHGADAGE